MKDYLESLIVEQMNRALTLKKLIQFPLKYAVLTGLANRCSNILDSQVHILMKLRKELHNREEKNLRDIFRETRVCTRTILEVEYFGIPALYYQTPQVGFLNNLVFEIHKEIKLPFAPPSVCCTASEHYHSHLFTNVIFAPLSESEFLLHLPDLYHEIGHCVLMNMESELRLKPVVDSYHLAFSKVTNYYNQLLKSKQREFGPKEIPMIVERIHSLWKSWINEFFCDLFALYTAGTAYAWAHLHLTIKRSDDIHTLSILQRQTHPSDESRMRILIYGLMNLDMTREAERIKSRWRDVATFWGPPPAEYQYAYPESLLRDIPRLTLEGLRQSGFSVVSRKTLEDAGNNTIRGKLNEAWRVFWKSKAEEFRSWEKKCVENLQNALHSQAREGA